MNEKYIDERLAEYNNIFKKNEEIYRSLTRKLNLSECSFWILYTIRTESSMPFQNEICASLHQPKQTINSALKKLEADGYIMLTPGNDLRSKQISLTERGVVLCEKTVDLVIKIEKYALTGLSNEEIKLFFSLFNKYTNLLENLASETTQGNPKK